MNRRGCNYGQLSANQSFKKEQGMKVFQSKACRVLSLMVCLGLLLVPVAGWAGEVKLTILHTNDHHGHFMKFSPYPVVDVGGLAAQSTLINVVRAEVQAAKGFTLVLSAGDINTGVPESDLLNAEPDIQLMNAIGFDVMELGNHEFDNPREVLMEQKSWAKFPFICANAIMKDSGKTLVQPYIIKEFEGLKVAIFGLITDTMPTLVLPANIADLTFKNPIDVAKELVPKLKAEADIVIALTHLGFYKDGGNEIGDIELAKAVPDIDVIVGGHTHTALTAAEKVGKTLIVQAGAYSQYVGRLDLVVNTDSNTVTADTYKLLSVNGKTPVKYNDKTYYVYTEQGYVEDKALADLTAPYLTQAGDLLAQPVGEALVELVGGKEQSRSQETNLGNLITDAMRDKTGADIAFLNGGGIRAGIAPGTIAYRDVLTVQPFGNTLVTLNLTGEQVMQVLNYAATVKPGAGAFLHVGGLKWTLNRKAGAAEKVMAGDAPLDLKKTYKVVTNNFMAAGGDGYAALKDLPKYDTNFVDADALKEYIGKLGKVEPKVEGRLTIVE
jgi:5'-nucleotidase / UDP-sugar diphosphatase